MLLIKARKKIGKGWMKMIMTPNVLAHLKAIDSTCTTSYTRQGKQV